MTTFATVYNRFLGKVTDDMYVELTPEDTLKDLKNLLIEAIPGFEFPRQNLYDYKEDYKIIKKIEISDGDFVLGDLYDPEYPDEKFVVIENSHFNCELTSEEINILSMIMLEGWLQRQITSIENTRMKFSGTDFKFTSQANHLSKLQAQQQSVRERTHHLQRLYKRRKFDSDGRYKSNWRDALGKSALD